MKQIILAVVLSLVSVGAFATNPPNVPTQYSLVGAILIVDVRNDQVTSVGVNIEKAGALLATCNAIKTAIMGTGFTGGNYDFKTTVQRTYSLTCVTDTPPAPAP